MARIEGFDQSLDGPSFSSGIPSFEDDADGRSQLAVAELSTVDKPEMKHPELRFLQPLGFFVLRHASGKVGILQLCVVVVGGCHDAY